MGKHIDCQEWIKFRLDRPVTMSILWKTPKVYTYSKWETNKVQSWDDLVKKYWANTCPYNTRAKPGT